MFFDIKELPEIWSGGTKYWQNKNWVAKCLIFKQKAGKCELWYISGKNFYLLTELIDVFSVIYTYLIINLTHSW